MKNKLTAVEWLAEKCFERGVDIGNGYKMAYKMPDDIFEQAKEMEKEQIINAHKYGEYFSQFRNLDDENGKQYYNETYNK